MKPVLIAAVIIVNVALISYTIGIITEQRKKVVSGVVISFLTLGIITDITATGLMIMGSESGWFTLHGVLGYSSLGGMLTDTILIWKHRLNYGSAVPVPRGLHLYSRIAYSWWVIAYISGGVLVALK